MNKKEHKTPLLQAQELKEVENSPREETLQFNPPKMNIPPQRIEQPIPQIPIEKINQTNTKENITQNIINETLIILEEPTVKKTKLRASDLPETSEELLQNTIDTLKKKILSEDRRNVIRELCKKNSVSCLQGKVLLDTFRISFEKKQILEFITISDPENLSVLLETFDFVEDRNLMYEKMNK